MPGSSVRYGALAGLLIAAAAHAQTVLPAYGITLIPAPSGSAGITPAAISSGDQETGSIAFFAGQAAHAFLYTSGTVIDLGTLPYPGSTNFGSASGQSISDGGVIVGNITDTGIPPMWQFGFMYSANGVLAPLNMLTGFPFCTRECRQQFQSHRRQLLQPHRVDRHDVRERHAAADRADGRRRERRQRLRPGGRARHARLHLRQRHRHQHPAAYSGGSASTQSSATSINNAGQAVGWQLNGTTYPTFLYSYGATTALTRCTRQRRAARGQHQQRRPDRRLHRRRQQRDRGAVLLRARPDEQPQRAGERHRSEQALRHAHPRLRHQRQRPDRRERHRQPHPRGDQRLPAHAHQPLQPQPGPRSERHHGRGAGTAFTLVLDGAEPLRLHRLRRRRRRRLAGAHAGQRRPAAGQGDDGRAAYDFTLQLQQCRRGRCRTRR